MVTASLWRKVLQTHHSLYKFQFVQDWDLIQLYSYNCSDWILGEPIQLIYIFFAISKFLMGDCLMYELACFYLTKFCFSWITSLCKYELRFLYIDVVNETG